MTKPVHGSTQGFDFNIYYTSKVEIIPPELYAKKV